MSVPVAPKILALAYALLLHLTGCGGELAGTNAAAVGRADGGDDAAVSRADSGGDANEVVAPTPTTSSAAERDGGAILPMPSCPDAGVGIESVLELSDFVAAALTDDFVYLIGFREGQVMPALHAVAKDGCASRDLGEIVGANIRLAADSQSAYVTTAEELYESVRGGPLEARDLSALFQTTEPVFVQGIAADPDGLAIIGTVGVNVQTSSLLLIPRYLPTRDPPRLVDDVTDFFPAPGLSHVQAMAKQDPDLFLSLYEYTDPNTAEVTARLVFMDTASAERRLLQERPTWTYDPLAASGGTVCFGAENAVECTTLALSINELTSVERPLALAIDGTGIYWEAAGNIYWSANVLSQGQLLFERNRSIFWIGVDDNHIYWWERAETSRILRASKTLAGP